MSDDPELDAIIAHDRAIRQEWADKAALEQQLRRYKLAWGNARERADAWRRLAKGADDEEGR